MSLKWILYYSTLHYTTAIVTRTKNLLKNGIRRFATERLAEKGSSKKKPTCQVIIKISKIVFTASLVGG